MSVAVSIYIYDHTPSGESQLYKRRKFSVHGTVSYIVFQSIPGYDVLLLYAMDRFSPPPDLCLSTCKEFIVNKLVPGTTLLKLVVYVYYRNTEKTGMLYILKLVCLLLKHKKKRVCCTY